MVADGLTLLAGALPFLWVGLTVTGLCFLALWNVGIVEPEPRCGALLLLVSAAGAARALAEFGPPSLTAIRWLPFVAAPLLVFVALFALMGHDVK